MAYPTLSQCEIPDPFIILAGDSGSGKTALATTLGEGAVLYAFETGYITALTLKDKFYESRIKTSLAGTYIDEGKFDSSNCAWSRFTADLDTMLNHLKSKPANPPTAFIFDSLTSMQECCMRHTLSGQIRQPEFKDWSVSQSQLFQVMGKIRSMTGIRVLIAHLQRDQLTHDLNTGLPFTNPVQFMELAVPGKNVPNRLASMANDVWQLKTTQGPQNTTDRVIQTVSNPLLALKTQFQIKSGTSIIESGLPGLLKSFGYDYPQKQQRLIEQKLREAIPPKAVRV
jgi:hypothetical protein